MTVDFEYEVIAPQERMRGARDWWSIVRALLAVLWATAFILFTSSNYQEIGSWLFIFMIWLGVGIGSLLALGGRYVRSGSVGLKHVRARAFEFTGAIMASVGWFMYLVLTVAQMIAVDDPVPAMHPFDDLGLMGPTRLAVTILAMIMLCLTLERVFEISGLMRLEGNQNKGKVTL